MHLNFDKKTTTLVGANNSGKISDDFQSLAEQWFTTLMGKSGSVIKKNVATLVEIH
ncbi:MULTISPECIES: hypothetical protein [unclassified Brenneria]|uniref:hypothetical protein n=1 Tax=unclassified Brenneria TaxID=2634434 RepID=UPI001C988AEC|nr:MULTISPECIES: hypothetical protein [unclassified Brenneria]MDX5630660.1 hypothetical protein [Brenneria sp. L3-3Z]MDX5697777.1 hypothetical protein [Brenneria sp. L4-2C]